MRRPSKPPTATAAIIPPNRWSGRNRMCKVWVTLIGGRGLPSGGEVRYGRATMKTPCASCITMFHCREIDECAIEAAKIEAKLPNGTWEPIKTYPLPSWRGGKPHVCWPNRWCPSVRAMLDDGMIVDSLHFAEDLSGEEQPPFSGRFVPSGQRSYRGLDHKKPIAWQPCTAR